MTIRYITANKGQPISIPTIPQIPPKRSIENNTQKQKTLYKAFKKYGLDNFEFSIIEECLPEDRFKREKYWIDYYNTYEDGYNETRGGEGLDGAPKAKGDNHPNSLISEAVAIHINFNNIRSVI